MEEAKSMQTERKHHDKKMIQTKVIVGKGEEDFFLEVDFDFTNTEAGGFFKIESVDTWVDVYNAQVINGNKVIFNAWVYKNILYKTVGQTVNGVGPVTNENGTVTIKGGIDHITKRIPLAGCIDIKGKNCEKLSCKDEVEVLDAYVIGDVEENLDPTELSYDPNDPTDIVIPPMYEYSKLHEKMCVKVEVKVVRWEHLEIEVENKHC